MICFRKQIKSFNDVDDINKASTSIQAIWDDFEFYEFTPTTLITKIIEFADYLAQKKAPWKKSQQAPKLFPHTFVDLTKTSSEVFLTDWTRKSDLHPSAPGSMWTAANTVLGSSFQLKSQSR